MTQDVADARQRGAEPGVWVPREPLSRVLEVVVENDATQDTDRYYSNAIHFAYGAFVHENLWLSGRIGHEIYSPRFLSLPGRLVGDRPYASWLFAQGEAQLRTLQAVHGVALRIGLVGPASGGETFQVWAHRMFGTRRPKGWDTQLGNRATVQAEWESGAHTEYAWGEWSLSAAVTLGAEVGNTRIRGQTGGGLMVGLRTDPSDTLAMLSEWLSPVRWAEDWGLGLFVGGTARLVGYDLFIEDPQDVEPIRTVGEFRVGMQFTYREFRFRYVHVFVSPEFRAQPEHHGFGAFRLSVSY